MRRFAIIIVCLGIFSAPFAHAEDPKYDEYWKNFQTAWFASLPAETQTANTEMFDAFLKNMAPYKLPSRKLVQAWFGTPEYQNWFNALPPEKLAEYKAAKNRRERLRYKQDTAYRERAQAYARAQYQLKKDDEAYKQAFALHSERNVMKNSIDNILKYEYPPAIEALLDREGVQEKMSVRALDLKSLEAIRDSLAGIVEGVRVLTPTERVTQMQLQIALPDMKAQGKTKDMIAYYWGLADGVPHTGDDTAAYFNVTKQAVSQANQRLLLQLPTTDPAHSYLNTYSPAYPGAMQAVPWISQTPYAQQGYFFQNSPVQPIIAGPSAPRAPILIGK